MDLPFDLVIPLLGIYLNVGNRPAWFQKLETPLAKAESETLGP